MMNLSRLDGASTSSSSPPVSLAGSAGRRMATHSILNAFERPRPGRKHHQREDGPILTHLTSTSPKSRCVAPVSQPPSAAEVSALHSLIAGSSSLCVITGAGCSTESNIPDYRTPGTGAYSKGHKPMTHQQFMGSESARKRYWARSFAGWKIFNSSKPNGAHFALARLEQNGHIGHLITQNVDRLHQRAGSSNVTEIHGTTHEVICMSCGHKTTRGDFQERLASANDFLRDFDSDGFGGVPYGGGSEEKDPGAVRPDGDVDIVAEWEQDLSVPSCSHCGTGLIKPDVVFFGDNVKPAVAQTAMGAVEAADALLVVGSSLQVFSAFRLVKRAHEGGKRIGLLTVGDTRADDLADFKIEVRAGEALAMALLHDQGSLDLPATASLL